MPRKKTEKKPKPPTFFKERKEFINRIIGGKVNWPLEMKFSKTLFEKYPSDFLSVVVPPFKLTSLSYFIGEDGDKFLKRKLAEFLFKPNQEKIQVFDGKIGEDLPIIRKQTIRQFLNEKKEK